MTTTIWGMRQSVDSRNQDMLYFAAQIDLDLVDLLENYLGH